MHSYDIATATTTRLVSCLKKHPGESHTDGVRQCFGVTIPAEQETFDIDFEGRSLVHRV